MCLNNKLKSLISKAEILDFGTTANLLVVEAIVKIVFILVIIVNIEIIKIKARFLAIWAMDPQLSNSSPDYNSNKLSELSFGLINYNFLMKYWFY